MKYLIFMLISVLATGTLCAQKISSKKIPTAVSKAFHSHFTHIKKAKWEIEDGNYEAEYSDNGVEHSALFKMDGTLLETEVEIDIHQLPKSVIDYVVKNIKGKKIKEASIITDANGKKKYEAEVGGKDYLFDESGNMIK